MTGRSYRPCSGTPHDWSHTNGVETLPPLALTAFITLKPVLTRHSAAWQERRSDRRPTSGKAPQKTHRHGNVLPRKMAVHPVRARSRCTEPGVPVDLLASAQRDTAGRWVPAECGRGPARHHEMTCGAKPHTLVRATTRSGVEVVTGVYAERPIGHAGSLSQDFHSLGAWSRSRPDGKAGREAEAAARLGLVIDELEQHFHGRSTGDGTNAAD